MEVLDARITPALVLPGPVALAPLPLPAPLVPDPGDQQILGNVLKMAVSNRHVLEQLPVPYVIVASANGVAPSVTEGHAHAPVKIDADQSKSTGQGGSGFDIQVEVDAYVDPVPHLELTVDRLGSGPFAQNLSVVVAFPFAGFDLEPGLPATPNLVMGFQTRAVGDTPGGSAPLHEVIDLTPGTLAGTSHTFQATMSTTGAQNPLGFILGNLDGTNLTGTLSAAGFRAYVETVPATINTTVTTMESALASPATSSFALDWQASSTSLVKFDYLENLTNPATAGGPDFSTRLTADIMPTVEKFSLSLSEPAGALTLSQHANAAIGSMTFQKTRGDGLAVVGNASNVPTQLDLALNLAGSATLSDNSNVGSLAVQASKAGGFAGTSGALGSNVGTVGIAVTSAPSLTAGLSAGGGARTFTAAPAVPGNVIGSLEFLASSNSPASAQLPTPTGGTGRWSDPTWDVFSMIDTGTGDTSAPAVYPPGATVAARLLNLLSATFLVHSAPLGSSFDLNTTTAAPLQTYLRSTPTSQLTPGHDDEITCEIANVPAGETKFYFNGPTDFGYSTDPPTGISSIHSFGHIDSLSFDVDAGGLPAVFSFLFDPDSMTHVLAQDGHGGNAYVGHLAVLLGDPSGIALFPDAGALFGPKLKKARLRLDDTPTITGTWVADDAGGNTVVNFVTVAPGLFAGGAQFAASTDSNDPDLGNPLTPAASLTADYAGFEDAGAAARNMSVGVVGIDSFSYSVANASDIVHINWDDNRPVPFNLNVGSVAGGVYFAGSKVSLSDHVGLVPTHLDYTTNLDYRQTLVGTNAIPFLDLTFNQNQGLPAGTTLTVHADSLPPVSVFDYEPTAGTFSVLAQDLAFQDTQKFGDLSFDLECPTGLPGTAGLLGAAVEQARLRLDNVPSFQATYATTAAGTTIGLQSVAPGLSIGGAQLQVSTKTDLPPLGPPAGGDADVVTLSDPGGVAAKHLVAQLFGLTNFTYSTTNATNSSTIQMAQDAARRLTATVVSNHGAFFSAHNVDAAIVIDQLPKNITLTSNFVNQLAYTASSGINSITAGGSTTSEGTFDSTKFSLGLSGLPAALGFDLDPLGHLTVSARTAALSPDSIGNITGHLHDPNGLGGGSPLLGAPVRDIRVRADSVPSFHATWSTSVGTAIHFDADNPGTFLGDAQVALSGTEKDTVPPIDVPGPGSADYVKLEDDALGKRLAAGLFGVGHFALTTQDPTHGVTVHYASNAARELRVAVDSVFGKYFSAYDIHALLDIQNVPQTTDLNTDLASVLNYTASSGIDSVTATADVNKTNNSHDNTHVDLVANGLPSAVNFTLDPDTGATLTMSDAIALLMMTATSDNTILGTGTYRLFHAELHNIPARWNANWSSGQLLVESKDAGNNPAPMGLVAATLSTSDDPGTNAADLLPFQTSGPGGARINYSPYLQEIDKRYFSLGTGAPATLAKIQDIYNNAQVLGAGEDHAVALIAGGSLNFLDAQFTGFQKIAYQPNSNGGHYEFDAPTPGPHPFLAGAGMDSNFLVAHVDNIPASAALDIDLASHNVHFTSSASAGTIDVYYGPQGMAQDSDTALRAVLQNTPTDVTINWDFGFPNGAASFKASNPFTLLLLAQDGSHRLVGGMRLQELDVNYGMNILPLDVNVSTTFLVPTNLTVSLFSANAGINVGSSGVPVDGFFNLYDMKSGPDDLTPAGPSPGASEYIPQLTFMMNDFTDFSVGIDVGLSITILPIPGVIHPSVSVNVNVDGNFRFDVWQNSDVDATLFDAIGYVDAADYSDNTPIQLVPVNSIILENHGGLKFSFEGFSGLDDHFDPLA